jgi:hypothetical protein
VPPPAPRGAPHAAEQVKKPVTPLSLRVSGHLLLGLSRIFAKKVAYLAADASEVITKLKTVRAARGGGRAAGRRVTFDSKPFERAPALDAPLTCPAARPLPLRLVLQAFRGGVAASETELLEDGPAGGGGAGAGGGGANIDMPDHMADLNNLSLDVLGAGGLE